MKIWWNMPCCQTHGWTCGWCRKQNVTCTCLIFIICLYEHMMKCIMKHMAGCTSLDNNDRTQDLGCSGTEHGFCMFDPSGAKHTTLDISHKKCDTIHCENMTLIQHDKLVWYIHMWQMCELYMFQSYDSNIAKHMAEISEMLMLCLAPHKKSPLLRRAYCLIA